MANWPPSARLSNSKMETRGAFHNSIQQKFWFEISEIPRAYWNGTFRLHSPDPSRIQKRGTGTTILSNIMARDISVRPTEITGPVKVDHLQGWSRTFRSDQIEMVRSIQLSIWCINRNFRNFGLNGKRLTCLLLWTRSTVFWEIDMSFWLLAVVTLQI